jgi:hypothetical protein
MPAKPATTRKRISVRRIKRLRTYRLEEAASATGAHKRTVEGWVREGLQLIEQKRPFLIRGSDLIEFHKARIRKRKQRCLPGQMFCLKCRSPRFAEDNFAYFHVTDHPVGNLSGFCASCGGVMNRRVSKKKLDLVRGNLLVTVTEGAATKRADKP